MKVYQDSNNLFHVGEYVTPSHTVLLHTYVNGTIIKFKSLEKKNITGAIKVENVRKEDGSFYNSLDELISIIYSLFTNIVASSGSPLEAHPDWYLKGRLQGGGTRTAWDGAKIIWNTNDNPPSANVQNLSYRGIRAKSGIIEFDFLNEPTNINSWAIIAAKMVNTQNIIGARINGGNIEFPVRINGTWGMIGSCPAQLGHWKVYILTNKIILLVDGVEVLRANHLIAGEGYLGMSMHRFTGTLEIAENYTARKIDAQYITHNGVQVTHNTEDVYMFI